MFLGLAKILGVAVLGGGIITPIVYSLSSSPQKFTKSLSGNNGPILTCVEGDKKEGYELYLKLSENSETDSDEDLDFQIIKVSGDKKEEVKEKANGIGWKDFLFFGIVFDNQESVKKVRIQTAEDLEKDTKKEINCSNSKIIAEKDNVGLFPPDSVLLTHISLLVNKNQCSRNDNKKECNIQIKSGDRLKWSPDFQPKVTYTTI